ncbi:hypothetical protein BDR26DRAFT_891702 [Obelidium mucronatum]|nr:hypothetical protein BDR26DRAFT_891702 [Obelidium mucronatum]
MADNNEQTPPSQAPIKKRGRKLAEDEDHVDKRRTQIRLAQRNFRERKETRIRELEQQVAALLSAACAACAEKAARIAATQGADSPLADVSAPVSAQLRLAASAEGPHPATTAMRFGLPAVERGCCALKRLPSLKECTHVDELFELLMKLSHCPISDRKTIRKHLMEMIWVKYKLFDQCLAVDKEELTKAVHIIESVHEENANHLVYIVFLFYFLSEFMLTNFESIRRFCMNSRRGSRQQKSCFTLQGLGP